MPKQHFIAEVGNSKLHAIILCVINIKLIIGKTITALAKESIMFANLGENYTVYRDVLNSRQVGGTFNLANLKHKD